MIKSIENESRVNAVKRMEDEAEESKGVSKTMAAGIGIATLVFGLAAGTVTSGLATYLLMRNKGKSKSTQDFE